MMRAANMLHYLSTRFIVLDVRFNVWLFHIVLLCNNHTSYAIVSQEMYLVAEIGNEDASLIRRLLDRNPVRFWQQKHH